MNQYERLVRRIEKRQEEKDKKAKADKIRKVACLKEITRLWKICGKLWQYQAKKLEKEL